MSMYPVMLFFYGYAIYGSEISTPSAKDCGIFNSKLDKAKNVLSTVLPALNNLSGLLSENKTTSNHRPVFYVRLSYFYDLTLGAQQTAIFDNVVTNNGNMYNKHTGICTAPVDGFYYFSLSFISKSGHLDLQMLKNDVEIGRGLAYPDNGSSGSMNVAVYLTKGDIVKVRNPHNSSHTIHHTFSSFAGYLL